MNDVALVRSAQLRGGKEDRAGTMWTDGMAVSQILSATPRSPTSWKSVPIMKRAGCRSTMPLSGCKEAPTCGSWTLGISEGGAIM